MAGTKRQRAIATAVRRFVPLAPLAEVAPILDLAARPHLRAVAPQRAAWLAVAAHVRHAHTPYDALLAEGYDRASARHFVLEDMERVLTGWGCRRAIDGDPDAAGEAEDDPE
jgi:hypothetical protein